MSAHVAPVTPPPAFPPGTTRRRKPRGRIIVAVIAAIVVIALVAAGFLVMWTVRRPLPQTDGSLQLPGLTAQVTVVRDDRGVPQIYAQNSPDLFRAQGYIQAQDRFFEMDYRRHVTAGRLAELVGNQPEAIEADKVVRTFGWRRVAEEEWKGVLSQTTKSYLQAYADGVNEYLKDREPGSIALEYTVLGLQVQVDNPEPWSPIDSVAWLKAMAWDLRGNYDDELDRALAFSTVQQVAQVDELFPEYPAEVNTPILPAATSAAARQLSAEPDTYPDLRSPGLQAAVASADKALKSVPVLIGRGEGTGSNSWVVSGQFTTTGSPMLANDPHLSLGAPGVWAQVGLHCSPVGAECPFDVAGFSFAGFPGVIIGHNGKLAWGLTNMGADVTDFYIERVRDKTYLRGNNWVPLPERHETIKVNGGDDIDLTIKSTTHGPILSTVIKDMSAVSQAPITDLKIGDLVVSLSWTALQPGHTADAVFAINLAANAADIQAAAAQFEVPAQNIVFATTDGHIGYQAPGKIPIRQTIPSSTVPSNGSWPRPGWDLRYDWTGYVDPAQMPRVLDPPEGFIVAANQAVTRPGVGPYLTTDWDYGYRSQRIRSLISGEISSGRKISAATMSTIQADDWSPYAAVLVPFLLKQDIDNSFDADGQKLLANWDYRMDKDSPAAAYFASVWNNLLKLTFWDDLPKDARPSGGSRWLAVVQGMLANANDKYWDDRQTVSVVEARDEVLTKALKTARKDLTVKQSKQTSDWQWGKLHMLSLEHPVLGGSSIPAPIRGYFNPSPIGLPGGSSIVNANAWDASSDNFAVTAGPSMRMVVDLKNLDESTWVTVTGTSGHPASSHYDDQLTSWSTGKTFAWPFSQSAVDAAGKQRLELTP